MIKTATAFGLLLLLLTGCSKFDVNFSLPPTIVPVEITIPPDSIKLDPYGFAPLSALVKFSSTIAGNTYISVKRKNVNSTDVNHLFSDMGLNHSIPVIGLYANFLNTVDIRLVNSNGDTVARSTINIQTGPLPGNLPTSIKATVAATGNVEPGLNLVSNYSSENPHIPFMVDNYGDIRWLLNYKSHPDLNRLDYSNGIKRLRNGNFYFGDINTDNLYEVDLLGKILNTWKLGATGYIFHHDIDEMPNGNFIISVDKQGSTHLNGVPTAEDYVIEVDRQTTAIKTVWDLKESLDELSSGRLDEMIMEKGEPISKEQFIIELNYLGGQP